MANRIYTRTGDAGTTGIHGGTRVPKDDPRIEANGDLDELNCHLGLIRSMLMCPDSECSEGGIPVSEACAGLVEQPRFGRGESSQQRPAPVAPGAEPHSQQSDRAERASIDAILYEAQKNLMTVMSLVATPSAERQKNPNALPENLVAHIEATMDALTEASGPSLHFLLPGGTPLAAQLQLARAVCRRAERRLWTLNRQDPVPEDVLKYINRLSDLLFVMARCELTRQDWPEERWKAFAYKNQK
jgi:Uncharacterized conserved protein